MIHNLFQILKVLEKDSNLTQRKLSNTLGVSLGKINYCIVSTGFSEFGWVLFASFKDVVGNIIWLGTPTFLPAAAVKFDV